MKYYANGKDMEFDREVCITVSENGRVSVGIYWNDKLISSTKFVLWSSAIKLLARCEREWAGLRYVVMVRSDFAVNTPDGIVR